MFGCFSATAMLQIRRTMNSLIVFLHWKTICFKNAILHILSQIFALSSTFFNLLQSQKFDFGSNKNNVRNKNILLNHETYQKQNGASFLIVSIQCICRDNYHLYSRKMHTAFCQVRLSATVTCNQYYLLPCGADGAR